MGFYLQLAHALVRTCIYNTCLGLAKERVLTVKARSRQYDQNLISQYEWFYNTWTVFSKMVVFNGNATSNDKKIIHFKLFIFVDQCTKVLCTSKSSLKWMLENTMKRNYFFLDIESGDNWLNHEAINAQLRHHSLTCQFELSRYSDLQVTIWVSMATMYKLFNTWACVSY